MPFATCEIPCCSAGHSWDTYSAWLTPVWASEKLRMRPSPTRAGRSINGRMIVWNAWVAFAGSVPSGQPGRLVQSLAKLSNASWNPAFCLTVESMVDCVGSIAPSSSSARTFCGNASA